MIDYNKPILNKDGKPLKILMSGEHFCVRIFKRALALMNVGYEVHGLGAQMSYGSDRFKTFSTYQNEKQFKDSIKMYINMGIDIVDYSNEPHVPAVWAREVIDSMGVQDRVKLISDLHDVDVIRQGFASTSELDMVASSDGIIYVSLPIQNICNRLYNLDRPNTVIYSYCNKEMIEPYDETKLSERKGIVYEGGLNPPDDEQMNKSFAYRDLYKIVKKLVEMGNETHLYCGNMSAFQTYQNTGAILHPPTIYNQMMKELTKFKYGLCVFNNEDGKNNQVNYTLANKMFEGSATGTPILACYCPEIMRVVDKWGIGFTFNNIEEIGNCSQLEDKYLEKMNNIKIYNSKVYMENFIWRVEQLYSKVLGVEGKNIPDNIKELSIFEYGKEDFEDIMK